jgi:hypothetical protein
MKKQKPKKAWVKPELTVLVRSKPEEVVLTACKTVSIVGPSVSCGASAMSCKLSGTS